MSGKKDHVFRIGAPTLRHFIEALQCVHFTVPERIFGLVVGFSKNKRQIRLAQQGRTEHLVAFRHTLLSQRNDILLDNIDKLFKQFQFIYLHSPFLPALQIERRAVSARRLIVTPQRMRSG